MKYGSIFDVVIKDTAKKGKGVFAKEAIPADCKVFTSSMLPIPEEELDNYEGSFLRDYFFKWGETYAIGLGYATYMNHSNKPNIRIIRHIDDNFMEGFSMEPISRGSELLHHYADPIWFPDYEEK